MISSGEISPGDWFTLRQKPVDDDRENASTWSDGPRVIRLDQSGGYSTTTLFCAEVVDFPLIWVRLMDGRRCLIDTTGYDLCEVKPELLQAVQTHLQTGGATATAFDDLVKGHNSLADAVAKELNAMREEVKRLKPAPESKGLTLLKLIYWAGLAGVLLYASFKN